MVPKAKMERLYSDFNKRPQQGAKYAFNRLLALGHINASPQGAIHTQNCRIADDL